MDHENTDEIPVVRTTKAEQLNDNTKRGVFIISTVVLLALFLSVALVVSALSGSDDESLPTTGEVEQIQTNEERIAEAEINLEDLVEEPTPDLLQTLLDTDFFESAGFSSNVTERLNEQAQDQLDSLLSQSDALGIEAPNVDDLDEIRKQAQDLLEQTDWQTVGDVRDRLESLIN